MHVEFEGKVLHAGQAGVVAVQGGEGADEDVVAAVGHEDFVGPSADQRVLVHAHAADLHPAKVKGVDGGAGDLWVTEQRSFPAFTQKLRIQSLGSCQYLHNCQHRHGQEPQFYTETTSIL